MNEEDKMNTTIHSTQITRKLIKKLRKEIHNKNSYWVSADRIIRGLVIQELEALGTDDDISDIK